ncbi:MAG TPA: hypothetical protein VII55_01720 [Candidatus Saccharimonadales bacterium]
MSPDFLQNTDPNPSIGEPVDVEPTLNLDDVPQDSEFPAVPAETPPTTDVAVDAQQGETDSAKPEAHHDEELVMAVQALFERLGGPLRLRHIIYELHSTHNPNHALDTKT